MKESANITLADINRLVDENDRMKVKIIGLEAALREIADTYSHEPRLVECVRIALERKTLPAQEAWGKRRPGE